VEKNKGYVWRKINELYLEKNLKIFPIIENAKKPLIKAWQIDCSSDYRQCLYWNENATNCNWGLPASENNLFIIDCDVHDPTKNGVENFNKLLDTLNVDGETLMQETPSGGRHFIFQSDEDLKKVANNSNVFADYPGIDIRTDGYIVVEPSSIDDKPYRILSDVLPQPMPEKLKEYILDNCLRKDIRKNVPYEKPREVFKGDRDNQLFQYINQLYFKTRLDFDEVLLLANNFNENILEEPFSEKDVKYKVKKAFEKDRGSCIYIWLSDSEE